MKFVKVEPCEISAYRGITHCDRSPPAAGRGPTAEATSNDFCLTKLFDERVCLPN